MNSLCNGNVLTFCALLSSMAVLMLMPPQSSVDAIAVALLPAEANETNFIEDVQPTIQTPTTPARSKPPKARAGENGIVVDDYVQRNQHKCFETRSLVSCMKYKAAKVLWRLATNALGYFPNEHGRELIEDKRYIRVVQLAEPADEALQLFSNARTLQGDNEWSAAVKFLQRSLETFGRNHGLQLVLSGDTGARISATEMEEPRLGKKKRQKWLILLPLLILMKIAHLKMTVVTLMLAVLGLNVVLVGGTAWLIHYLKFKTLCKIHPHLVQSHSHVYDSDPADYSTFVGSGHTGAHYGAAGYGSHEAGIHGWANKEWASSKAYSGHNYLDTISKRLQ